MCVRDCVYKRMTKACSMNLNYSGSTVRPGGTFPFQTLFLLGPAFDVCI